MKKIDLHIHSYYSCDGEYSPRQLVEMAKKEGLAVIALTDHNTVNGITEALITGEKYGVEIVPGIEIDVSFLDRTFHILGYYLDWKSSRLSKLADSIADAQYVLIRKMVRTLKEMEFNISYDEVLRYTNRQSIPGAATIAEAILKNKENQSDLRLAPYLEGEAKSRRPYINFMYDHMAPGRPAYIQQQLPGVEEVINLILKLGGIPVLAHPGLYLDPDRKGYIKIIKYLIKNGLRGIEAFSSYHDKETNNRFFKLGLELNLLITAGSDFHGKLKPEITIGQVPGNDYQIIEKIKKHLTS
jgi:3',5'-nucleoside bisphosphate phosphatase